MGLSPSDEGGASQCYLGGLVSVWYSVVSELILINYYVTGLMVIHQLVVNSHNKFCQHLKANAVESANLRAS